MADFDDWPEFHEQGMGCGLEDRCITDRYEAMRYGWDEALDRVAERMPKFHTAAELESLREQVRALEKDAARYQHIRALSGDAWDDLFSRLPRDCTGPDYDKAIDTAMENTNG